MQKDTGVVSRIPPEAVPAIRLMMGKLTPLAVAALVNNLVSEKTSPAEKRKAAELILAYGWGRPVNVTVIDDKAPSHVIIDQTLQNQISDTFNRIDKFLTQKPNLTPEVAAALSPLKELTDALELPDTEVAIDFEIPETTQKP